MKNAVLVENITMNEIEEMVKSTVQNSMNQLLVELKKNRDLIKRLRACEMLGVSVPTIVKMTKEGKLIDYRINGEVKYDPSEIEDYIQSCRGN
jgi:excisionase family DNA binding protein